MKVVLGSCPLCGAGDLHGWRTRTGALALVCQRCGYSLDSLPVSEGRGRAQSGASRHSSTDGKRQPRNQRWAPLR